MLPETLPRPCLLVRVSSDVQETEQQEYEALAWIRERYGVVLVEADIFREKDVSGTREFEDRPGLKAAVAGCLSGRYTHLVVRKIDRGGRNVAVMSRVIRDLVKHGIPFIAITENVDTMTDDGVFKAHLFLAFAEQFISNLRAETTKGKNKRRRLGLYNGHLPYGALRGADDVPIADMVPITIVDSLGIALETTHHQGLCLLFQLAAEGRNPSDIAREMNRRGYRTHSPRWKAQEFGRSSVRHVLDNRFYLGELAVGPYGPARTWTPGAHAPLIAQSVWDAAHAALAQHTQRPDRAKKTARDLLFGRGMLRCWSCRTRGKDIGFHAAQNGAQTTFYICGTRNRGQECRERMIREDTIERAFLAWLGTPAIDEEELAEATQRYLATLPEAQRPVDTTARKATLKGRLARLAELYELGEYERPVYLERRRKLQEEIASLDQQGETTAPFTVEELQRALVFVRDFPTMWTTASRKERGQLVRTLVRTIWVQGGRIVEVEPTPAYQGYFALRQAFVEVG